MEHVEDRIHLLTPRSTTSWRPSRRSGVIHTLDARRIVDEVKALTSLNTVVLGAYAALPGVISPESLRWTLGYAQSRRFLDSNMHAFDRGYAEMKKRVQYQSPVPLKKVGGYTRFSLKRRR